MLFVILVGAFYINPANWRPFAPFGMTGVSFFGYPLLGQVNAGGQPVGMIAGAAIIFFAYIGFDSVSTHAEEARNPRRDVPIGIIASLLICTLLYIAVVAVLIGFPGARWNLPTFGVAFLPGLALAMIFSALGGRRT